MKFAVLDLETTGFEPHDEVIQAGLVLLEENRIVSTYASLVRPSKSIPPFIERLTGISDAMLEQAPELDRVMGEIEPLLEGAILVAHNARFDLSFLQRAFSQCGLDLFNGRVLDTIDFLRFLYPGMASLQLNRVCEELGIPLQRHHQADSDAEATGRLWLHCLERLEGLPLLTLQRLCQIFDGSNAAIQDIGWFLNEVRGKKELTTGLDLDASDYFRQFAIKAKEWPGEQAPREDADGTEPFDKPFPAFYAEMKQNLQAQFAQYEERQAQEQMIEEVYESFERENHLMVEAGTGTGKSIGYLIPALYYGIQHGKKVLVSTHTINLQEQIRHRDIPLLQRIFPVDFRASVLKGRNHYLCLRKFENKVNGLDLDASREERITAAQMVVWLGETENGDEEELHFTNGGKDFWRTVESDTESCMNRACPWFKRCFFHRSRHEANIADVVITNHSMLFTDVKADHRLLPAYEQLVIDEAHHFEQVASKHLGTEVGYFTMLNSLSWLFKDSRSGQLPFLRSRLDASDDTDADGAELREKIDALYPKMIKVKQAWDELTEQLYQLLLDRSAGSASAPEGQMVYRLKPEALPSGWAHCQGTEDNLYIELGAALKILDPLLQALKETDDYDIQSVITDLSGTVKELYRHREAAHHFMQMGNPEEVYWLEANSHYKSKSVQMICVPLDISPMLRQHFFEQKESIVMTSATLSVEKSFQYTCEQLGLQDSLESGKLRAMQLPSPFNYRQQALVLIPRDFPSVRGTADEVFVQKLSDSLNDVALETKGRMMVLFTSYRMLKQVYKRLAEPLEERGIQLLAQGVGGSSRTKLLRQFQDTPSSILLGTSSFWEGIDIPGEALSCLVIVRLPFQPPNHPLNEAKCEAIQRQKKNPFIQYSVPQAVIRFKQGFGRLVRTASDRGIVIIYDTRVIDTAYGKHFLYSLPGPKIEHMPADRLVPRIREWLGAKAAGEEVQA